MEKAAILDQPEVIIALLIGAAIWQFIAYRKVKKRNEEITTKLLKLEADNALLEAEHLKFQLQPHTLNNILANLKVIANRLNKGMDALSETLDYILYKGNKHLVSVRDEVDFINKYLDLNELFISEINAIKKDLSEINHQSPYYNTPCVPHLITAYFIENAFKHGDINHPEFLQIKLKLNNQSFEIIVVNRIKQKNTEGRKGGLGLTNMRKRLELLHGGKYEITQSMTENEYLSRLIIRF